MVVVTCTKCKIDMWNTANNCECKLSESDKIDHLNNYSQTEIFNFSTKDNEFHHLKED